MASHEGAIATEAPINAHSATAPPTSTHSTEDVARILKRNRESSPSSPRVFAGDHSPLGSPAKSARLALAAGATIPQLTGAAALEDERRRREAELAHSPPETSDNPSHSVLNSLMSGGTQVMSRPGDAPIAADAMDMTRPALTIPHNVPRPDEDADPSPHSATSMHGLGVTASPASMEVDNREEQDLAHQVAAHDGQSHEHDHEHDRPQPGSLSYPGTLQSNASAETPQRQMSFPVMGAEGTSPTSGNKKHKCPYCNQEFTRHHNLKSHLLTHSQEKPYVCTDCQMRFRRLHDLKRHGKLHTGEKNHICPKCDRKFARGDALARHTKGQGGCAGRRSSMGSFADGDEMDGLGDPDETAMTGLSYDNPEEEELRRQSMPGINNSHMGTGSGDSYSTHSRTYPPAGPRPSAPGMYAGNVGQGTGATQSSTGTSTSAHTGNSSMSATAAAAVAGGAGMFSQTGMTESPKPLSPGLQTHDRPRSPSLTQQLQQQSQFGRRQSDLSSPHNGQGRQAKISAPAQQQPMHQNFSQAAAPAPGFSHSRNSSGPQAHDSGNMFAQSDPQVWQYIQSLEEKVKALTDRVFTLENEVATRKQGEVQSAPMA